MTNFVKDLGTLPYTPSGADVNAGDVILVGDKVCVAKHDIKDGELGTLSTCGQFDFPRTSATEYLQGKKVYWDVADQEATEDDDTGVNKLIGYVAEYVGAGEADTVPVRCALVETPAA